MIFMALISSNSAFRFASFNIITLLIDLHMADVNKIYLPSVIFHIYTKKPVSMET